MNDSNLQHVQYLLKWLLWMLRYPGWLFRDRIPEWIHKRPREWDRGVICTLEVGVPNTTLYAFDSIDQQRCPRLMHCKTVHFVMLVLFGLRERFVKSWVNLNNLLNTMIDKSRYVWKRVRAKILVHLSIGNTIHSSVLQSFPSSCWCIGCKCRCLFVSTVPLRTEIYLAVLDIWSTWSCP